MACFGLGLKFSVLQLDSKASVELQALLANGSSRFKFQSLALCRKMPDGKFSYQSLHPPWRSDFEQTQRGHHVRSRHSLSPHQETLLETAQDVSHALDMSGRLGNRGPKELPRKLATVLKHASVLAVTGSLPEYVPEADSSQSSQGTATLLTAAQSRHPKRPRHLQSTLSYGSIPRRGVDYWRDFCISLPNSRVPNFKSSLAACVELATRSYFL